MKSKKKKEKIYFDFLLKLAYFDFGQLPEISEFDEVSDPFISLLFEYSKFLAEFEPKYPFLKAEEKYNNLTSGLFDPSSYQVMPWRRQFFLDLQLHLLARLEKIMELKNKDIGKTGLPLISMQGNQEIYIDDDSGTFLGRFRPAITKDNSTAELDLEEEKQILDLILSDIMINFSLMADRFHRCERCSNIFYQYTANEKIYCSPRCSNAERQSRFVAKIPLIK